MYIDRKGIGDASTAGTVASIMQVIGIVACIKAPTTDAQALDL